MAVRTMLTENDFNKDFSKNNYNFGSDTSTKHFYLKCNMEINNIYNPQAFNADIEFDFTPNITGAYPAIMLVDGDQSGYYDYGFSLIMPVGVTGGSYSNVTGTVNGNPITESFFTGIMNVITANAYILSNFDWDFTKDGQIIETNIPMILQGTGGTIFPTEWITEKNYIQYFNDYYAPTNEYWLYYNHDHLLEDNNPILERLINISEAEGIPDGLKTWYLYNTYSKKTYDEHGKVTERGPAIYRFIKFRSTSTPAGYVDETTGLVTLKYKNIYDSGFNSTGSQTIDLNTLGALEYDGPFYDYYNNQIGELYTADNIIKNFDFYTNESDAQKVIDGEQPDNPPKPVDPFKPGKDEPSDNTELTQNTSSSIFGKVYNLTRAQALNICNVFFTNDNNIFDNIKKGLEQYGASPIDSIISLAYYPIDIDNIGTWSTQEYITFGSYRHELGSNIKKLEYPNKWIECNGFMLNRKYNDWRDYEPYTLYSLYIPFVGIKQLDSKRYLGKLIKPRYIIDLYTNTGICALFTRDNNGSETLIEYFNCSIGVQLPVQGANYSKYASDMIRTMVSSGMSAGRAGFGMMNNLDKIAQAEAESETGELLIGATALTAGFGAAGIGFSVARGINALASAPKPADMLTTKGNFSAGVSLTMPNYFYVIYDRLEVPDNENYDKLIGRPTDASGTGEAFRGGYFQPSVIQMNTSGMTQDEARELESILRNGVYM